MTRTETTHLPLRRRLGLGARISRALAAVFKRRRDRQQLGHLDPHLLRDIGLDAGKVAEECSKPFWRA